MIALESIRWAGTGGSVLMELEGEEMLSVFLREWAYVLRDTYNQSPVPGDGCVTVFSIYVDNPSNRS